MATLQEIIGLESGAGRSSREVQNLIQRLRQDLRDAQIKDKQFAKNIESTGKAGLKGIKTRRDYLLAKRGNPELSFKDFLLDDKTSAKYMEQGANQIMAGNQPGVTLKETLGLTNPMQSISDMQATVDKAKSSNMYKYPLTQETAIQSPELNIKRNSLIENNLMPNPSNVAPSLSYEDATVKGSINSLQDLRNAPIDMAIESVPQGTIPVPVTEEVVVMPSSASTDSAAGKLGTAGAAIGAVSSLKDLGTKGLSPSTAMNTAGSGMTLASKTIPGAQVLALPGMALKFLSGMLGKYN